MHKFLSELALGSGQHREVVLSYKPFLKILCAPATQNQWKQNLYINKVERPLSCNFLDEPLTTSWTQEQLRSLYTTPPFPVPSLPPLPSPLLFVLLSLAASYLSSKNVWLSLISHRCTDHKMEHTERDTEQCSHPHADRYHEVRQEENEDGWTNLRV